MNDAEAIKMALSGREDGYNAIFANHSSCLFTYALRLTRHRETAEDIVQETFNDAFRFLSSFKGRSSLRTWLYKILFRKMLKEKERKRPEKLEFESGNLDSGFSRAETKIDTASVLEQLAEKERSILMLAYWDELKLEEIAEILEISLSNAKVSLFRARRRFAATWLETSQKGEKANEL